MLLRYLVVTALFTLTNVGFDLVVSRLSWETTGRWELGGISALAVMFITELNNR